MTVMAQPVRPLSDQDLLRYLQCPHWLYWELYGDIAHKKQGMEERELLMRGTLVRERALAASVYGRLSSVRGVTHVERAKKTLRLMKRGAAVIYGGCIEHEDTIGNPTLLIRKEEPSALGTWSYIPVLVKRKHTLRKEDHLQIGWHARILSQVQGLFPTEGYVLGPDKELLPSDPRTAEEEVKGVVEELDRIRGGECPEPTLRKACVDVSPWGVCCRALAEETQDIALLFQVNRRQREALRQIGIRTVQEAAEMDPAQYSGLDPRLTLKSLQAVRRQALALRDDTVHIRAPFVSSDVSCEIHFDIESYPPTDTDYLFGCLVRDRVAHTERFVSFAAKRLQDEKHLWKRFITWTETLPPSYIVYHYSMYERERIELLMRRYGTEAHEGVQRFLEAMVDLNELVKDCAVFPLYIYSLKNIGAMIGATWQGDVSHGADSVGVYARWLSEKRSEDLAALVAYNAEDTQATAKLVDWLATYADAETIYARPFPWEAKIR